MQKEEPETHNKFIENFEKYREMRDKYPNKKINIIADGSFGGPLTFKYEVDKERKKKATNSPKRKLIKKTIKKCSCKKK